MSSKSTIFLAYSTPIVDLVSYENLFYVNLYINDVFPTPESPTSKILNYKSSAILLNNFLVGLVLIYLLK